MPVTGYTATGASSMYAMLGDAEKSYEYLDFLIKHKNVSPTTMYAEGNPVIESPLSFATCYCRVGVEEFVCFLHRPNVGPMWRFIN
jgi:hypothetical protein